MSWTDERIATLKRMWEEGCSASQIAENLGEGVTRNAVIGKAHRLGLASRPSPVKGEAAAPTAAPAAPAAEKETAKPAAAPAAPAAPAPAPHPAKGEKGERITLLKLTERMCKWPIGHPGEPDFHFCGKKAVPAQPYCAEHCAQAYQAAAPRRDRGKPQPPRIR